MTERALNPIESTPEFEETGASNLGLVAIEGTTQPLSGEELPDELVQGQVTDPKTKVIKLASNDNKRMPFLFFAGDQSGESFEKTYSVRNFKRLPDEDKVLIGLGQVHTEAFSCFDTEQSKINHVVRLFHKGKSPEKLDDSRTKVIEIIEKGVEGGLIQINGQGPELTGEGVRRLKPQIKSSRANKKEALKNKIHPIEYGDDDLLKKIVEEQCASGEEIEIDGKFPLRPYKLLIAIVEGAKGKIKSKNQLAYVVKELTSDSVLARDSRRVAKYLSKNDFIINRAEKNGVDIEVTGKGISVHEILSSDEENKVIQASSQESSIVSDKTRDTLELFSRGEFEIEEGSSGWIFGKNSKGDVVERIQRETDGNITTIQRMVQRLVEVGYIEVLVDPSVSAAERGTVNGRLTKAGREYLDETRLQEAESIAS